MQWFVCVGTSLLFFASFAKILAEACFFFLMSLCRLYVCQTRTPQLTNQEFDCNWTIHTNAVTVCICAHTVCWYVDVCICRWHMFYVCHPQWVYEMFRCTCVLASKECGVVTKGLVKTGLSRQTVALGCLALSPFQYSIHWEGRTRLYQFTSRDSGTDQRNIWMTLCASLQCCIYH